MTKEEYENFVLRYKGCGACFPMYHTLSRFEKMWFTAIQKDVAELERKLEQTEKELFDYQFNYPTIIELEKEKAELKDDNMVMANNYSKMEQKFDHNLAKAKELLKKWVFLFSPKLEGFPKPPIQVDTEQFLKEQGNEV